MLHFVIHMLNNKGTPSGIGTRFINSSLEQIHSVPWNSKWVIQWSGNKLCQHLKRTPKPLVSGEFKGKPAHSTGLYEQGHFNPARAIYFGGLWEAGVNSVKTHLHRILKDQRLTYEEFSTIIIQIEACLNSRPLCPLSNEPEDYEALTPSHFLIWQALMTTPHPDVKHITMNRLSRFQCNGYSRIFGTVGHRNI